MPKATIWLTMGYEEHGDEDTCRRRHVYMGFDFPFRLFFRCNSNEQHGVSCFTF